MKLVWTRPSLDDRRAIRNFIAADNPKAAIELDLAMSVKAARLLDHPGLGRPGRVPGTRELVIHPNYILIYDIDIGAALVRVLRVLHAAQMWPANRR